MASHTSGFSKTSELPWQLQVFAVSIRKKEKWRWAKKEIERVLQEATGIAQSEAYGGGAAMASRAARRATPSLSAPSSEGEATRPRVRNNGRDLALCLDVGSGVGTLSTLMERLGGSWEFTETDHAAAQETRKIVKGPVYETDIYSFRPQPIPPPDGTPPKAVATYNLITVFDVIEHVLDPQRFISRLAELLTPGGTIVLTTPADGHGYYFWRRLAEKLFGIDKTAHGHVVEGFSRQQLETLTMRAQLHLIQLTPFSFFFTEMIELAYNAAYIFKNRAKQRAAPGYNLALSPASSADVAAHGWQLCVLRAAYPLLLGISLIDRVIPIPPGYEWVLVAHKPAAADYNSRVNGSPRHQPQYAA